MIALPPPKPQDAFGFLLALLGLCNHHDSRIELAPGMMGGHMAWRGTVPAEATQDRPAPARGQRPGPAQPCLDQKNHAAAPQPPEHLSLLSAFGRSSGELGQAR